MATSLEPETSPRYVEFHEYVDYQLAKTRTSIKTTDLLTALTGSATLLVAYVLGFVVLDHWAIPGGFSYLPRLLLLGAVVLMAAAWVLWRVVLPVRRRVTAIYAASSIERAEPELQSNLLNLVDLQRSGRAIPADVKLALERRAALALSEMDIDEAVDRRGLLHLSYALLAVVLLFCVYTLLSPKSVSASVWRALFPAANVAVATRTEILSVQPGDAEVVARAELDVKVDLRGERPDEVVLHYTTADRRYVDEPVLLRQVEEGLMQYAGTITGDNGRGILQNLTYSIQAGDARSQEFHVTVLQPPSARVDQVTYEYPAYMELMPRTQPGGQIDTWEGATVSIMAQANMPVRSAVIKFSDTEDTSQKAEELRMTVTNKTHLEATWQADFRPDGTFPRFYRIVCTNERGDFDPEPALHSIVIHPDKPPEVSLLSPEGDLQMPANGIVPLSVEARDPDFQLREVALRTEKDGQPLEAHSPVIFEGRETSFRGTYDFELAPLRLQPGDELTYWIEARDNKQPLFNRRNTSRLKIQIVEPVSEEEAKQQLAADKQKQEERQRQREEQAADRPQADDAQADDAQAPEDQAERESGDGPQEPTDQAGGPDEQAKPREGEQQEGQGQQNQAADGQKSGKRQQGEGSQGDPQQGEGEGEGQKSGGQQGGAGEKQPSQASDQAGEGSGEGLRNDGGDDDEALRRLYEKLQQRQQDATQPNGQEGAAGERQPDPGTSNQQPQPGAKPEQGSGLDGQPQPGDADPNAMPAPDRQNRDPNATPGADRQPGADPDAKPGEKAPPGDSPRGEGGKPSEDPPGQPKPTDERGEQGSKESDQTGQPSGQENKNGQEKQPGADSQAPSRAGDPAGKDPQQSPERAGQDSGAVNSPEAGDPASRTPEGAGQKNPDPKAVDPDQKRQPPNGESSKQQGQRNAGDEPVDPQSPPAPPQGDDASGGEPGSSKMGSEGQSGSNQQGAGEKGTQSGQSQSGQPQSPGSEGAPQQGKADGEGQSQTGQAGEGKSGEGGKPGDGSPSGGKSGDGQSEKPAGEPREGQADAEKPGEKQAPQGEPGSQAGEGSKPGEGQDGQSGKAGQEAGSAGGESSSPSSDAGPAGGGQKPSDGAAAGSQGSAEGAGTGDAGGDSGVPGAEEANLEFAKKAANLVLKNLEDGLQRGEVDQELLKELGWNEADMKKFSERLKKQLETPSQGATAADEARRRQFEEMLKNLHLKSSPKMRSGDAQRKGEFEAIDARRVPIPPEFRDAFDDYTKSLSQQKN